MTWHHDFVITYQQTRECKYFEEKYITVGQHFVISRRLTRRCDELLKHH